MLSDKEWEVINKKYKNLFVDIAYHITGDIALSIEDCIQELTIAAIECVDYFRKNHTKEPFDVFVETSHFQKYFKTALWNKKNSIGKVIVRKESIYNNISLDDTLVGEDFQNSLDLLLDIDSYSWDKESLEILNLIKYDSSLIKRNGTVCVTKLSKALNKPKPVIVNTLGRIKSVLVKNNMED